MIGPLETKRIRALGAEYREMGKGMKSIPYMTEERREAFAAGWKAADICMNITTRKCLRCRQEFKTRKYRMCENCRKFANRNGGGMDER